MAPARLALLLCVSLGCSLSGVEVHLPSEAPSPPRGVVTLVSWNAHKSLDPRFGADLADLLEAERPDLLLLQEGVRELASSPRYYGFFAPSWRYPWPGGRAVGVVTLSALPAVRLLPLNTRSREFEIIAPKTSLVTEHPLAEGTSLLAANVHLLAFERFGLADLRGQVAELGAALAGHAGPLVLAGDFNVWSRERLRALEEGLAPLGLVEVTDFAPTRRTGDLGAGWLNTVISVDPALPLDRVYVRDLAVVDLAVLRYESSDHAALRVTLAW